MDYNGDPSKAEITTAEIEYLLNSVNEYFKTPVRKEQVRWTYAGVRPLYDDGANKAQEATRDYELILDGEGAPVLSVFGGKITTYRRLAEQAMDKLARTFPLMGKAWTAQAPLPGGDFDFRETALWIDNIRGRIPDMPERQAGRLFRCYGTRTQRLLQGIRRLDDLGENFGGGLRRREVDFLMEEEWATSAEDILWRRTKLGLWFSAEQCRRLQSYMEAADQSRRASAAPVQFDSA
jgi:glycerol-3-phosphate dehydrogenase